MKSKNVNDSTNLDKSVNDKLAASELACNETVTCGDSKSKEKIKTSFAQIIVRKIKEKPYFEILYFDNQDKCFHIGFGSFYLEYVFQWLADEFEIIEGISEMDFSFQKETEQLLLGKRVFGVLTTQKEKRLIDANALKERAIRMATVNSLGNKQHCYFKAVGTGEIDKAPTVDAVEVVQCKDCKYYEIHKPTVLENCERNGMPIPMKPDDFCSYGERIDNGC